jgi:hypothetical protein
MRACVWSSLFIVAVRLCNAVIAEALVRILDISECPWRYLQDTEDIPGKAGCTDWHHTKAAEAAPFSRDIAAMVSGRLIRCSGNSRF